MTKTFGARSHVDLIDMQSMECKSNKWILVHQDHLTKFCMSRPLTSKRANEVAYQLLDIFLIFGAPEILQSDNGAEFTASVIRELAVLWPELKLVHGKPRHPESQGSVERANCDIKDMLIAWLDDKNTTDWALGLKFVQFRKNSRHHCGINQSPYAALFGFNQKVGLASSNLPTEILSRLQSEDDLAVKLTQTYIEGATHVPVIDGNNVEQVGSDSSANHHARQTSREDSEVNTDSTAADILNEIGYESTNATEENTSTMQMDEVTLATSVVNEISDNVDNAAAIDTNTDHDNESTIRSIRETINSNRQRAADGLVDQAERMVKRSRRIFVAGNAGDNVTIPIPMVDRGKGDPRNIMGVIMHRDDNDMHRIAVKSGIMCSKLSRNQFDILHACYVQSVCYEHRKSFLD